MMPFNDCSVRLYWCSNCKAWFLLADSGWCPRWHPPMSCCHVGEERVEPKQLTEEHTGASAKA